MPVKEQAASTVFCLAEVLAVLGVSQRKLARLMDVEPQHVAKLFKGRIAPKWETAVKIARVLGLSVGTFSPGDPAYVGFFEKERKRK